ncbi:unnamed protein product [Aphanomyces euteiches]
MDLVDRIDLDCRMVTKLGESSGCKSLSSYGDNRKNENLDRICRQYVADPSDRLQYTTWNRWKLCIDSGYALAKLGQEMTSGELFQVYQYGKSIDAGFQAVAFKQFFHCAIYEAKMSGYTTPKINMRTAYPYPLVELVLDHVHCRGMNESECMDDLARTLDLNTYWHPENATFPMIDAVALCREYQGFNVRGEINNYDYTSHYDLISFDHDGYTSHPHDYSSHHDGHPRDHHDYTRDHHCFTRHHHCFARHHHDYTRNNHDYTSHYDRLNASLLSYYCPKHHDQVSRHNHGYCGHHHD